MTRGKTTAGTALAVLLLASVLVLPAAAADDAKWDGVPTVANGAEPANGHRTVHLQEQWRAGGEDGEDFFGLITQCIVGGDGTIYLLDTRLAEVAVYAPDGERKGTLSREGEGPGETRLPANLLFMPDGTLGLVQIFPGRIVKVGLDDTPQGTVDFGDKTDGGFLQLFDCMVQDDRLVLTGTLTQQNPPTGRINTSFAAAYGLDGKEVVRYEENRREIDFNAFHWVEDEQDQIEFRKVVVGKDGRVYVAGKRNEYRINVYEPDGTPDRVITRSYEHRQRTPEEFKRMEDRMTAAFSRLPDAKFDVSKTEPDITALRLGRDGNIWVESSRGGIGQPEGVFYTWDVYDPDGKFIEQVSAACPGDGDDDMLLWTAGGAVQVTGFMSAVRALQGGGAGGGEEDEAAAPMEVICYKTLDL